MTIIDKLNALLQKAINYTQEGFREAGYDVDFQSTTNPTQQNQQYGCSQQNYGYPTSDCMQQAYPKHPNVAPENYNPNSQQTFINIDTQK